MTAFEWRKAWRLNRWGVHIPEEVQIADIGGDQVLVKGEQHTVWRGNFHATKEKAFDSVIADEERSLRSSQKRLEDLRRARERHCKP